ncbi:hypothetical protein EVAR_81243_1 [Eumeta japonica]|uniref:Uncharacterized protein n=1 Tax=Eumeta variegata TaxID=151549 RepID=A0A4C1V290_EUMVA|nr:hypothetical protein EVAR_81243_1 [Eumeta japonica]
MKQRLLQLNLFLSEWKGRVPFTFMSLSLLGGLTMPEWKGRVPLTRSHCERITCSNISRVFIFSSNAYKVESVLWCDFDSPLPGNERSEVPASHDKRLPDSACQARCHVASCFGDMLGMFTKFSAGYSRNLQAETSCFFSKLAGRTEMVHGPLVTRGPRLPTPNLEDKCT